MLQALTFMHSLFTVTSWISLFLSREILAAKRKGRNPCVDRQSPTIPTWDRLHRRRTPFARCLSEGISDSRTGGGQ